MLIFLLYLNQSFIPDSSGPVNYPSMSVLGPSQTRGPFNSCTLAIKSTQCQHLKGAFCNISHLNENGFLKAPTHLGTREKGMFKKRVNDEFLCHCSLIWVKLFTWQKLKIKTY